MRTLLNGLYRGSGALAASCLVAICLLVVAQVLCRIIDAFAKAVTGDAIGLVIPSVAEFAAFLLVGAAFLGLAYTLRHGSHIRVTLLTQKLPQSGQRLVEIFCLLAGFLLAAFCGWHALLLVVDSWQFHEQSYGVVSVSLWIPQLPMALGLLVLAVALLDDLIAVLLGGETSYQSADASGDLIDDLIDDIEVAE